MKAKPTDVTHRGVSFLLAGGINGLLFSSIFLLGMTSPQPEPPELVEVQFLEIARKSDIAPKPKQLVRITKPAPPPPQETDVIGLKKKKREELEKKKKRERKLAEKRRRDAEKKKRRDEARRKRNEERKRR